MLFAFALLDTTLGVPGESMPKPLVGSMAWHVIACNAERVAGVTVEP
jgi:hypothetical protein